MQENKTSFSQRLTLLKQKEVKQTLVGILHGVERESLRINPDGGLAQTPHQAALGSALTHDFITTDFSESLLEFITPPEVSIDKTIGQLTDVHKFVLENIGEERLWSMSMPCFIESDDNIPIANYGSSNVGRMKSLYRVGLKNRYGSMMQAISGVHFNFSLPEAFWQEWLAKLGQEANKDTISAAYFALIRNYRRYCWIIPYLYGASPALCGSFIKGKLTSFEFSKIGKGTYYLPYATSLRMSDLGYTNSAQSGLNICYNQVDTYIDSLRKAISQPSVDYQRFNGKKDGQYQQLNGNVLQIENELYSPIRPKQPTRSLEKPTDALDDRGVNYIEVRALDVNPFSQIGIEANQFYFLDVFLLYCVTKPSEFFDSHLYQETETNLSEVVNRGREPNLHLTHKGESISLVDWALSLFSDLAEVAAELDEANNTNQYSAAVEVEKQKVLDPSLTPSARILKILLENNEDNGSFGLNLADTYKKQLLATDYQFMTADDLTAHAGRSVQKQLLVEQQDMQTFDEFLRSYFESSTELEQV
ncbi:glutamate--cysteine ligase [Paraglaciecola aquimarina]|uniref:Glutamate--cysteine ligase n=1 Tax=Paraglaciecola algarum TaxID=3050085 RepID=A0ABS9DBU0_9ALTE|nr:glutamate--cysteine ligase [Paraglaciecola sp. G1-23]MCF2950433.1 glutamate--cysteine ligase [Paraglaciecola sp. G1-23]